MERFKKKKEEKIKTFILQLHNRKSMIQIHEEKTREIRAYSCLLNQEHLWSEEIALKKNNSIEKNDKIIFWITLCRLVLSVIS